MHIRLNIKKLNIGEKMSLDFDAIRKKLERLSGNNRNKSLMWRPVEGEEHTVRLLSFADNDGQPFKELWFYYNIGSERGLLTPHQFGESDPVQELINKLRDDGSKESYELAKKLYPNMRVYAAVIVRGEEDQGVRIWSFGKTVYQKLLGIMLDEDYGDITDPKSGRDIKVSCTKTPGKKWATTDVIPRGKSTQLSADDDQAQEWLTNIPDMEGMYTMKSYDEISAIIEKWLNGDEVDDEGTEWKPPAKSSSPASSNTAATKSSDTGDKSYSSLDDAFADLME